MRPLLVAALLSATALTGTRPVTATTVTYALTNCYMGGGCPASPPYGTVTVTSLSSTEVSVELQLEPGEVFNIAGGNGSGKPLLFDISGDPVVTVTNLTAPFTYNRALMTMGDGTGQWDYFIGCPTTGSSKCKTGVSGGYSGPISFDVTYSGTGGISPASFVQNASQLFFASDIGIPTGNNQFTTGDVAAPTATAVPLPPSLTLLGSALAALGLMRRRLHPAMTLAHPAA